MSLVLVDTAPPLQSISFLSAVQSFVKFEIWAEANRLNRQMTDLDAQSRVLMGLMMNPVIDAGALTAFSRQIAEREAERKKLEGRLARVASLSCQGEERLTRCVRTAYRQVRERFAETVMPSQLNRFVEDYIGPMELTSAGTVVPKKLPRPLGGASSTHETTTASDESEAVVNISVAGGGFEPPTSGL